MKLSDGCQLILKNKFEELQILRKALRNIISEDTGCEVCPYQQEGLGCPTDATTPFDDCVEAFIKYYKEHEDLPEEIANPFTKNWQIIIMWLLVDSIMAETDYPCEFCPVRTSCDNAGLSQSERKIESCHKKLWKFAIDRFEVIFNGSDEELLEQYVSTEETGTGNN